MTEELLNTVLRLYRSEIDDNIYLADNIVRQNGYNGRDASIIYHSMYDKGLKSLQKCITTSRIFYTLLCSRERQEYEKQQKNETII